MAKYSFSQLQDLWKQAGGNPLSAAMAAAIAMAESGGNSDSTNHNSNGTVDRGLWQINSIHGSLSVFDPLANAKAAVQISGNGTSWRPWCTAWSSGLCSGTYLGNGAPYAKFLPPGSNTGATVPSGGIVPTLDTGLPNPLGNLDPNKWVQAIFRPLGVWFWYGAMAALGVGLMWVGVLILISDSNAARLAKTVGLSVASKGMASKDFRKKKAETPPEPKPEPSPTSGGGGE